MKPQLDSLKERIYGTIGRRRMARRAATASGTAAAIVLAVGVLLQLRSGAGGTIEAVPPTDVAVTLADGTTASLSGTAAAVGGAQIAGTEDSLPLSATKNTLAVPRGKSFELTLSDGTHVWLNADSRLVFPAAFEGIDRRVMLEGEAFFDVAKDADHPFYVEVAGQCVRVLGTRFNVSAYSGEQAVFTLHSGSIALSGGGASAVLAPEQQAWLAKDGYEVRPANPCAAAWVEGEFAFGGQRLDAVMARLGRWYDFEVEFATPAAAAMRLSGEVPRFDDMETILRLIEASGEVAVRRNGKLLVISD